ncbi:P-type ATPase [Cupriavidus necator]
MQQVPGGIVLLDTGDRVPADGRLAASSSVEVDESARYVPAGKLHIGAFAEVPR